MKKIIQKTTFKLRYVLLVILFVSSLVINAVPARADIVSDLFVSDPDAPHDLNSEVGWWVTRSTIALFDNTWPSNSLGYTKSPPEPGVGSVWTAVDTIDVPVIGVQTGPVHEGHGKSTVIYTKSGELTDCTLSVTFTSPSDRPDKGTLSSVCGYRDLTVDLKKTGNARIDGWYTKQDDDAEIEMWSWLTGLSGCGLGSDVKVGSYAHNGKFTKKSNIKTHADLAKDGIKPEYLGPNNFVYLDETGYTDRGLVKMEQYAACNKNNNYTRYGDVADDHVSQGRGIFISKTPFATLSSNASDAITAFHDAKAKTYGFVAFFEKTEKYDEQGNISPRGTTNAQAAQNCYDLFLSGSIGGGAVPYAILTLAKGINGPYNDCLRKILSPRPGFNEIDSIASADLAFPPKVDDRDECSVGIPIIGDLICGLIKLIFNGVSTLFENALGYFGNTADTFDRLNKNDSMKQAWASVKNLANIIFLFSFLIVIFQYITDINVVDAYFVKKFIPKLIVAVVLVQASFWIPAEMNNLATALGQSIQSLLLFGANIGQSGQIATGAGAVAEISTGTGAFGVFGGGAFIVALVMGLVALIALLISVILLTVREIILVILSILAPLAFACIAIPQLEGMFKKWFNMYVKLLVIYPIMMMFIAVGGVVGQVFSDPTMNPIYQFMGFVAYFLPFILLPFTFKMAGGAMGSIAAKVNGMATSKGKERFNKTGFMQQRAERKKDREGNKTRLAGEKYRAKAVAGADRGGIRGRYASRGLGKGEEREKNLAVLSAQHAQDGVRAQSAQEQARKTVIGSKAFDIKRGLDTAKTAAEQDEIYKTAFESGDNEQIQAALQVAAATQNQGKLEQGLTILQRTEEGKANWNQALSDNYEAFGATSPSFKVRLDDKTSAPADLHKARIDAFKAMSDKERAGMKDAQWKNLDELSRSSPDAADHDLAERLIKQAHDKLDDKGEIKGGEVIDDLKRRAGL